MERRLVMLLLMLLVLSLEVLLMLADLIPNGRDVRVRSQRSDRSG